MVVFRHSSRRRPLRIVVVPLFLFGIAFGAPAWSQVSDCEPLTDSQVEDALAEHLFGGSPSGAEPHVRRGFVFEYSQELKVPVWSAWRAAPEYRNPPKRTGRWTTFRSDRTVTDVSTNDYLGWFDAEENYARGHIVPYFIAGGDRNHDGRLAAPEHASTDVDDFYDACTVYEINSMPNIAPQKHHLFNGQPGAWYLLETDIRHMVDDGRAFQIIAGTVFSDEEISRIGRRDRAPEEWQIAVPHGFFKIVIDPVSFAAVGFLFDHVADIQNGCDITELPWPSECIVPIEAIESITGLLFFTHLSAEDNELLRESSHRGTWFRWLRSIESR